MKTLVTILWMLVATAACSSTFKDYDLDQSGGISRSEFAFVEADTNHNGVIEPSEFEELQSSLKSIRLSAPKQDESVDAWNDVTDDVTYDDNEKVAGNALVDNKAEVLPGGGRWSWLYRNKKSRTKRRKSRPGPGKNNPYYGIRSDKNKKKRTNIRPGSGKKEVWTSDKDPCIRGCDKSYWPKDIAKMAKTSPNSGNVKYFQKKMLKCIRDCTRRPSSDQGRKVGPSAAGQGRNRVKHRVKRGCNTRGPRQKCARCRKRNECKRRWKWKRKFDTQKQCMYKPCTGKRL